MVFIKIAFEEIENKSLDLKSGYFQGSKTWLCAYSITKAPL